MKYRIIDTHCHPQFPQYDADRDTVIRRALDAGIGLVCVGTDLHTSQQAIELADTYEGVYASVGLHPNDNLDEVYKQSDYELLALHPKVVAIGEIGLDYYRTTDDDLKKKQRTRFLRQLELVGKTGKPIIIHSRDAHDDMIEILRAHKGQIRGVVHSFNGSATIARTYLDEGYLLGLNGIATFSKDYEEMIRMIPDDRLLLETDSPYLSPTPYRGKRNEPSYIQEIGFLISAIRRKTLDDLYMSATNNAIELLSIKE